MEEVNKILKKKSMQPLITPLTCLPIQTKKVPLIIASGEDYDGLTMTAQTFKNEAQKGGFKDVGSMLATYMPQE